MADVTLAAMIEAVAEAIGYRKGRAAGFAKAIEMATNVSCGLCAAGWAIDPDNNEQHLCADPKERRMCRSVDIRALRDPEAGDG